MYMKKLFKINYLKNKIFLNKQLKGGRPAGEPPPETKKFSLRVSGDSSRGSSSNFTKPTTEILIILLQLEKFQGTGHF
jgi:hypothetical protein